MFPEFIRETEIYQYILQEGYQQGIEQGYQQIVEQGREQARKEARQRLRQMIIAFVQARSVELVPLAQKKVEVIDSIETLNALVLRVGTTQNVEDVRRYLEEVEDK